MRWLSSYFKEIGDTNPVAAFAALETALSKYRKWIFSRAGIVKNGSLENTFQVGSTSFCNHEK